MSTGRTVVITGAGGGVGALLVKRFLGNGDTVLATDADEEALKRLRDSLPDPGDLIAESADISAEQDCRRLAESAGKAGGYVDVLINCAGFFPIAPLDDITADDWRKVIDINLMKNNGGGRIINFGSGSVFDGTESQAHYVAAKAGIVGFSRSLAREVGDAGITVNVITPGLTVTKSVRDHFPEEILHAQRDRRALKRDEQPEDLVGPVFFLASDDAGFITGQTVNVDGGAFMP